MANANSADGTVVVPLELHDVLFKADRPRAIDRYIDYFGASGSSADAGWTVTPSVPQRNW